MYLKEKNLTYKERTEFYYEKLIKKILNDPRYNENQREVIGKYEEVTKNRVNKISSVCVVLQSLRNFALFVNKDFNMVTNDDIMQFITHMRIKGMKKKE